jgi:hypothetical protein
MWPGSPGARLSFGRAVMPLSGMPIPYGSCGPDSEDAHDSGRLVSARRSVLVRSSLARKADEVAYRAKAKHRSIVINAKEAPCRP